MWKTIRRQDYDPATASLNHYRAGAALLPFLDEYGRLRHDAPPEAYILLKDLAYWTEKRRSGEGPY